MKDIILNLNPEAISQTLNVVVSPDENLLNLKLRLLYMEIPDHWYLSAEDAETGESYFTHVPLIGTTSDVCINILGPFRYKNIGDLVCIPNVRNPSSVDPGRNNLGEFNVVWSDHRD